MKIFTLALVTLMSVPAMAAPAITKISNNGSVNPMYSRTTTCKIEGRIAISTVTGRLIDFPHGVQSQVRFTRDVPNETVMASLIGDAARAPVSPTHAPIPAGGGMTTYQAQIDNSSPAAAAVLKQLAGPAVIKENRSSAAKKLVKLLDANCAAAAAPAAAVRNR